MIKASLVFSEKNIIHINKSRSAYSKNYYIDLPLLKNDTNNIIEYVEYQKDQNKKKYHFWKLLKND